jgi:hypothetical protein
MRHQLKTAIATQSGSGTGQRLNAAYNFGAGGRFTKAKVNAAITGGDIKRRDVDYVYGNAGVVNANVVYVPYGSVIEAGGRDSQFQTTAQ